MKKLLTMLIIGLLFSFSAFAKKYKENDVVENQFYLSKKFQIDLPKGKWIIVEKSPWFYYGMSNTTYTLVKLKKNKLVEAISVVEWRTAGVHEDSINFALNEVMFKNKYHGCYDKPKYTVMEFYTKGSTHNCFWVGHHNFIKFIYDPEDPELSGSRTKIKQWISENQINLPKGEASVEDLLLRQRQISTSFQNRISMGISYTFGSIFNNIVNNRL